MKVIYVSAFIDLYEDRSSYRTVEQSIELFKPLISSGIPLIVFISQMYLELMPLSCPNIQFIPTELKDLHTFKCLEERDVSLPSVRNNKKDTRNFLCLMLAKCELVKKAMTIVNADYYSWIDFNICHVLKDVCMVMRYLGNLKILPIKLLAFPGCWPKGYPIDLLNSISWRFCGGFFIGDRVSVSELCELNEKYKNILLYNNHITWETNLWAYIELSEPSLKIDWYLADHNDTIITNLSALL